MDGHRERSGAHPPTLPPTNVRILHTEAELKEAIARASESAKRLHDRLAARAARDAWMAEHTEQRVEWSRFGRWRAEGMPLVIAAVARPTQRPGTRSRIVSRSPAA